MEIHDKVFEGKASQEERLAYGIVSAIDKYGYLTREEETYYVNQLLSLATEGFKNDAEKRPILNYKGRGSGWPRSTGSLDFGEIANSFVKE